MADNDLSLPKRATPQPSQDEWNESEADGDDEADVETVLELVDVTKRYGPECAVEGLSLAVEKGELLTLLGPSGCGKTTTLRLLAGLEPPTTGEIRLGDRVVAGNGDYLQPEERGVGVVFQDFALFPHLTVEENIAFGLDEWDAEDREARLDEMIDLVGLEAHRTKAPDQLSGGQRQRVALARSLAPEPSILLLDEPFSNLDIRLRVEMREEVRRILKEAGVTAISVTHDQEEALSISDRVAVLREGHLEQVGRPEAVFEHPASRFVASFLGLASFVSAQVRGGTFRTPLGTFDSDRLQGLTPEYDGADVDVLVRPDDLRAHPASAEEANGRIVYRQYTGPNFVYRVELGNGDIVSCAHNHVEEFDLDQPVRVELAADHSLAWYPSH